MWSVFVGINVKETYPSLRASKGHPIGTGIGGEPVRTRGAGGEGLLVSESL